MWWFGESSTSEGGTKKLRFWLSPAASEQKWNLAPGDPSEMGSAFDLAIALGILAACGSFGAHST